MNQVVLRVKNLSFSYQYAPKKTVDDISFELLKNDYAVLTGTNGSGKSTTAKIIAGLLQSQEGSVEIKENLKIGIVFQSPKDQIICSVVQKDTAFGPEAENCKKGEVELRTIEALSKTNMLQFANKKSMFLSLGQTQKIAISGILAINPDILILDEAVSMLDEKSRQDIFSILEKLNKIGVTILHITHDEDAIRHSKKVFVMKDGKILWQGKTEDFFNKETEFGYEDVFGEKLKKTQEEKNFSNNKITLLAKNINFSYGNNCVLKDISFSLRKGTLTALTGESGAGKSTLLEILAGLKIPTDFSKTGTTCKSNFFATERPVLCQQDSSSALFEAFAADDVAFGPKNRGIKGKTLKTLVKNSMENVGLPFNEFASRQTYYLSGGEKRRLSVAGIIALDSEIILFDEPTAGLDSVARKKVMYLLRRLADEGKTILFSTHHKDEADFADYNITIKDSKILQSESIQSSLENEKNIQDLIKIEPLEGASLIENFNNVLKMNEKTEKSKTSPIEKLPAILKTLIFLPLICCSLIAKPIYVCTIFFIISLIYALISPFSKKKLFSSILKIIPLLLFFCLFEMIFARNEKSQNFFGFTPEIPDKIFISYKYFVVSASKLWHCLKILLHTECAICCICAFFSSTNEKDIVQSLSIFLFPLKIINIPVRYIIILIEIIFRFIPLLIEQACNILKTQLIRGGLRETHGFFAKIRAIIPLIVPLIIQTIRRAEILADAITARGFK